MTKDDDVEDWVKPLIAKFREEALTMDAQTRAERFEEITEEATYYYRIAASDEALQRFAEMAALSGFGSNFSGSSKADPEQIAGLKSNIASCLHLKGGETDLAHLYYMRARDVFQAKRSGRLGRLVFGDLNYYRAQYIDARLELLATGGKPDVSKYLDGMGTLSTWEGEPVKPLSKQEQREAEEKREAEYRARQAQPYLNYPLRTYASPSAWRKWYRGEEVPMHDVPFVRVETDAAAREAEQEGAIKASITAAP